MADQGPKDPRKFAEKAKAEGYSDAEIQQYVQSHPEKFASESTNVAPGGVGGGSMAGQESNWSGAGASALQAAGLNIPGLFLGKQFRDKAAAMSAQAPIIPALAGALTGAGTAGALSKIPVALLAGGEGAIAGGAGAEPGQRTTGAITGGLLGGAIGALPTLGEGLLGLGGKLKSAVSPSAGDVAKDVARALHNARVPVNTMAENPETISASAALARVSKAMPGADIPAALTPETIKSVRAISANPTAAAAANDQAQTALQAVAKHQDALHAEYQAIQNGPKGVVEITPELRKILVGTGSMEGMNPMQPVVAFTRLQEIRQGLQSKLGSSSPQVQRVLKPALEDLQGFMDQHFTADPAAGHRALKDIDSDYAFSNVWGEQMDNYLKMLKGTSSSQAAQGVAGTEAVSPGGTLTGTRTALKSLLKAITPSDQKRAALAARLMAQPSSTIPREVAQAGQNLAGQASQFFNPPMSAARPVAGGFAGAGMGLLGPLGGPHGLLFPPPNGGAQ